MRYKWLLALVCIMGVLASCKKDIAKNDLVTPGPTGNDKIKDSVLLYARDIYFWYKQIPSDYNARNYADPNEIMQAIRNYSEEPGFSQPVDRWSFAYKQTQWDQLSSGVSQDFGLSVFFFTEGDLRVKYVEKNSPAGKAGIKRGWRINKINGNSNIATANTDFILQNVYSSNNSSFLFQKPDGSSIELVLNAATYQEQPIFLDSVYRSGTKNIGYLVFNSFLGDTLEIYNQFQRVFNRFSQEAVQEVIVDLRYNGGGYVNVQDKLANYLVNGSANGSIMMNQEFNDKYKQLNNITRFSKLGTINLNRVFFVVSKNTASASELLINNLKPYMDVKLVGPGNTYGKPVGFFPIPVNDWYIFPVSFRSTNRNGEGNYFNGLVTDNQIADGLDKDWGDSNESCLASIFKYIGTGSFSSITTSEISVDQGSAKSSSMAQVEAGNATLGQNTFKGAVDTRRMFD